MYLGGGFLVDPKISSSIGRTYHIVFKYFTTSLYPTQKKKKKKGHWAENYHTMEAHPKLLEEYKSRIQSTQRQVTRKSNKNRSLVGFLNTLV